MKVLLCLLVSLSVALAEKTRVGGAVEMTAAELADPALLEIANFAVSRIDEWTNGIYRSKLVQVLSGKRQVVAGYKYILELEKATTTCPKMGMITLEDCPLHPDYTNEICHVEIYVVPWNGEREVLEQGCRQKPTKRQFGGLAGGLHPTDTNSPKVLEIAAFAVDTINDQSNSMYLSKLVHIHSASTQVVAGINYHLELEIGATTCSKGDSVSLEDCDIDQNGRVEICMVTVFDQSWTGTREVISMTCSPKVAVKRQFLAGGLMPADTNNQGIQHLASLSVDHINTMRNAPTLSKLVEVTSAQYQVVAGMKYYLTMEIGTTSCSSSDSTVLLSDCAVLLGGGREMCDVEVLDQPWIGEPQVLTFSCTPKQLFP
ncbi:kininogen-1-like [Branchiostoma floridae x Branchiostoma japonicum]